MRKNSVRSKVRPQEGLQRVLPSIHVNSALTSVELTQRGETGKGWVRPRHVHEVVFHWSRKQVGMNMPGAAGAWLALHRRTGQLPVVHKSSKSVAAWRLRQGDATGVSVTLHGAKASTVRRTTLLGIPAHTVSTLMTKGDKTHHRLTFTIEKPRVRPQLEPHYELLRTRTSVPGLTVTVSLKDNGVTQDVTASRRSWLLQDRASRPTRMEGEGEDSTSSTQTKS